MISVNVFGLDIDEEKPSIIFPLRITKIKHASNHVNLLYQATESNSHYHLITNMSRLIGSQWSTHNSAVHVCEYCLRCCTTNEVLQRHQLSCSQHHAQRIEMPKPDEEGNPPTIKFKNIEHQLPAPFTIYADLECILQPYDTASPNPSTSSTTPRNKHIACGAAYYIVSTDKRFHREPTVLRGENVMSEFIERLISDVAQLKKYLKNIVKMTPLTAEQRTEFDSATTCHICSRVFMESDRRVRDHDHITGAYRGAAHASCNLNYRLHVSKTKITVFIHNLRNYDAHLILSAAKPEHGPITVIPNNTERYISYQIGDIIFKDSCQFMPSSLSTLTSNLQSSDFIHTKLHLTCKHSTTSSSDNDWDDDEEEDTFGIPDPLPPPGPDDDPIMFSFDDPTDYRNTPFKKPQQNALEQSVTEQQLQLLTRKGVYPYEFMDNFEKFHDSSLPSKDAFHSTLTGQSVSDEDYTHAQRVWTEFNCSTLGDYHDLYLLSDILLLADIFESFKSTCLHHYHLDPTHFYTSPGLAFDAALKMTAIELELFEDIDMHLFVEDGE